MPKTSVLHTSYTGNDTGDDSTGWHAEILAPMDILAEDDDVIELVFEAQARDMDELIEMLKEFTNSL